MKVLRVLCPNLTDASHKGLAHFSFLLSIDIRQAFERFFFILQQLAIFFSFFFLRNNFPFICYLLSTGLLLEDSKGIPCLSVANFLKSNRKVFLYQLLAFKGFNLQDEKLAKRCINL